MEASYFFPLFLLFSRKENYDYHFKILVWIKLTFLSRAHLAWKMFTSAIICRAALYWFFHPHFSPLTWTPVHTVLVFVSAHTALQTLWHSAQTFRTCLKEVWTKKAMEGGAFHSYCMEKKKMRPTNLIFHTRLCLLLSPAPVYMEFSITMQTRVCLGQLEAPAGQRTGLQAPVATAFLPQLLQFKPPPKALPYHSFSHAPHSSNKTQRVEEELLYL